MSRRRVRYVAVVAAFGTVLAGCGGGGEDEPAPGGLARPGTISASLQAPADCLTVLAADSPAVATAGVSRALFASAPAAIVAPAVEGPELRAATEVARTRGIPLLLHGITGTNPTTSTATPSTSTAPASTETAPCPTASPSAMPTASPSATVGGTVTATPGATSSAYSSTLTITPDPSVSPTGGPASGDPVPPLPPVEPSPPAPPSPLPSIPAASSYRDPLAEDDSVQCLPVIRSDATASPTATATPTPTATATPTATTSVIGTAIPTESAIATASPTDTATPSATASPTTAPGIDPSVSTELSRLAPQAVLAMTPQIADDLRAAMPSLKVVTAADQLPATTPGTPATPEMTVLVPAEAELRPIALAVAATAKAAGTRTIGVPHGDPRASSCAIEELSSLVATKVLAVGDFGPAQRLGDRLTVVSTGVELPGGGQLFFPGRRLVALYGHPGAPELGVLGAQGTLASIDRARSVADLYTSRSDVPVVPTFEIIVTVAQGAAGADGDYSAESDIETIRPWVEAARQAGVYVILDLQPGRTDFLTQARRYEELLKLPNVGLALDPEWRLKPGQVHLRQIGSVDAWEINQVANWLADLTARYRLPQKLLVLHQFSLTMITNRASLDTTRDEIAMLIHMDGQGEPIAKEGTWTIVTRTVPDEIWMGWKNFYRKDTRLMSAAETLNRTPVPVMISYQ